MRFRLFGLVVEYRVWGPAWAQKRKTHRFVVTWHSSCAFVGFAMMWRDDMQIIEQKPKPFYFYTFRSQPVRLVSIGA